MIDELCAIASNRRAHRRQDTTDNEGAIAMPAGEPITNNSTTMTLRDAGPDSVVVVDSSGKAITVDRGSADPEHRSLQYRLAAAWFGNEPAGVIESAPEEPARTAPDLPSLELSSMVLLSPTDEQRTAWYDLFETDRAPSSSFAMRFTLLLGAAFAASARTPEGQSRSIAGVLQGVVVDHTRTVVLNERTVVERTRERALAEIAEADSAYHRTAVLARKHRLVLNDGPEHGVDAVGSEHAQMLTVQPSGAVSVFWVPEHRAVLRRTKSGLMINRVRGAGGGVHSHRVWAQADQPAGWDCDSDGAAETVVEWGQRFSRGLGHARARANGMAVLKHLGPAPVFSERVPLLNPEHRDALDGIEHVHRDAALVHAVALDPWIDSHNTADVARKLFGTTRYRKPLARHCAQVGVHTPEGLAFYAQFRGLVPIDHIVEGLDRSLEHRRDRDQMILPGFGQDVAALRRLLRGMPQPVLSRLLRRTPPQQLVRSLSDAASAFARTGAGPQALLEAVELFGQRDIRRPADLERVVHGLPTVLTPGQRSAQARSQARQRRLHLHRDMLLANARRREAGEDELDWARWTTDEAVRQAEHERVQEARLAQMAERQRLDEMEAELRRNLRLEQEKERAAWALVQTPVLNGLAVPGLRVVVADSAAQLADWGARMHHCIGSYADDLGLDVFCGVYGTDDQNRSDELLANLHISQSAGLVQALGKYNQPLDQALGDERAVALLRALVEQAGVTGLGTAWGTEGLANQINEILSS